MSFSPFDTITGLALENLDRAAETLAALDNRQSANLYLTLAQKRAGSSQASISASTGKAYRRAIELFEASGDSESRVKAARVELADHLARKGHLAEAGQLYDDLIAAVDTALVDSTATTLAAYEIPRFMVGKVLCEVGVVATSTNTSEPGPQGFNWARSGHWVDEKVDALPTIASSAEVKFLQALANAAIGFDTQEFGASCEKFDDGRGRLKDWQVQVLLEERRRLEREVEELR